MGSVRRAFEVAGYKAVADAARGAGVEDFDQVFRDSDPIEKRKIISAFLVDSPGAGAILAQLAKVVGPALFQFAWDRIK